MKSNSFLWHCFSKVVKFNSCVSRDDDILVFIRSSKLVGILSSRMMNVERAVHSSSAVFIRGCETREINSKLTAAAEATAEH